MSFYEKKVEREKDKNHQLGIFQDCNLRKKSFSHSFLVVGRDV